MMAGQRCDSQRRDWLSTATHGCAAGMRQDSSQMATPAQRAPCPRAGASQPHAESILLVEDEPMVRSVIRRILERQGYVVLDAAGGEEALRICEERGREIHLVLTDMIMPGMTGAELARRAAPLCPNAQVLCMSGYTDDEVFRRGLLDGHTAFVQKPFTAEALAAKVRAVLDRPASSAA